jgi:hypothetical protein
MDGHHPGPSFQMEALNVMLNTYEQHKGCGMLPGSNNRKA